MRRAPATALVLLLVGVLAVVTPDAAAVGDVLVRAGAVVQAASTGTREIPDNGELSAEDIARLGGVPKDSPEPVTEMPAGDFSSLVAEAPAPTESGRRAALVQTAPGKGFTDDPEARVKGLDVVARDVFSTTYETESGSFVQKQSDQPLNVQDDAGEWHAISTELSLDDGRWETGLHPLSPSFADSADASDAVTVVAGDHEVSFGLEYVRPVEPVAEKGEGSDVENMLRLEDAVPGADVEYEVETAGVKETIILRSEPRVAPKWSWTVDVGDLSPVLGEDDVVELLDAAGAVAMHIPAPVAWDSSGVEEKRSDALINPTVALVHVEGSVWRYSISVSGSWLKATERVYPVYVDPTIQVGPSYLRSLKSDGAQYLNQSHIGNTRQENTNVIWRAYAAYDVSAAAGQFVGGTQLYVGYDGLGTTSSQPGNVYSVSGECYTCLYQWLDDFSISNNGVWTDGTGVALNTANHVKGGWSRAYFMITGNEAAVYSHKRVGTAFFMEYWPYTVITQATPASGATGQSLTPTLSMSITNYSPYSPANAYKFAVSANPDMSSPVWSVESSASQVTVPEGKLLPGTTYYWQGKTYDAHNTWAGQSTERATGVHTLTTQVPPPTPPEATATPGNASGVPQTVVTLTPTLQVDAVADPDNIPAGATVKYEFKIATGADGKTGAVFTSGLISADTDGKVRWAVPAGTLRDGQIYSWVVQPTDGAGKNTTPAWVKRIKVDLRLGSSGPSPFDTAGPVTVNLANGNANLSFSSPLISTLGGPIGMAFSYNSQAAPDANRGLTGSYYDGKDSLGNIPTTPGGYSFAGKTPLMVRTDSALSFEWAAGAPGPALANDYFMAQWSGFVRVPRASSQWRFGVRHDDGVRLRLNNTTVVDKWGDGVSAVEWSGNLNLTTAETPIQLDYYEATGAASVELWADDLADAAGPVIVPASWFTTQRTTLPAGWGSSVPIAGDSAAWAKATIEAQAVVLTDISGTAHTYARTSAGGYTPPAGEYGIVSLDDAGRVVYTDEGGTVYQFAVNGAVESATSVADGQKPAAPISVYNSDGTVKEVVDPVSKDGSIYHRKVSFTYQDATQTVCPALPPAAGSGTTPAPVGMLCKITYPATSQAGAPVTNLYYRDRDLWIIEDPGAERTVFTYNQNGILTAVQDSAATDYLLSATNPQSAPYVSTEISMVQGRVNQVTLPMQLGFKNYAYSPSTGTSTAAYTFAGGPDRVVTYDSAWRQTSETSLMGVTASQEWHPSKDLVLSSTNSLGLKSTTIYDPATDRATDTYGPAPAACFQSDGRPVPNPVSVSACGILPAHSSTTYDGGLQGLQSTYYANPHLAGKPALIGFGVGGTAGAVDKDWATGSPGAGIPADNWSLRMTGLVAFPAAGTYTFGTYSDDGARVWVGDTLVVDKWEGGPAERYGAPITVAAGESRRIRVEYRDDTSTATLQLKWKTPSSPTTGAIVPGTALRPDYGLITSASTDDSTSVSGAAAPATTTSMTYQHPWLGQATASTVDPAGLALKTAIAFEQPGGSGWLRRLTRTLPGGTVAGAPSTAKTTSTYYGDLESAPDVCGIPAGTKQFGMTKSVTGPAPATGSAITTEYAYDAWGRTVGTKTSGDTAWSCVTYDERGIPTASSVAGPAGIDTISTTTTRTVRANGGGYTTVTSGVIVAGSANGSKVTTVTDLLGRVLTYTDVFDTVTTPTYAQFSSRVTKITTTPAGGTASVTTYTYDLDGKVKSVTVDGQQLASVTYDALQRLQQITYPDGSALTGIGRDKAQRVTSQTWSVAGQTVTDTVALSQSGRVVQQTSATGTTTNTSTYAYDTTGRLTSATIPGHQLTYSFAPSGGCGVNTAAGMSGNRTGLTDVWTAPGQAPVATTTAYCYDWADRLTSSTVTGAISGATSVADGVAASEIEYDARGNTKRLGDMTFFYDAANRHIGTAYADGSTVQITRDATGRIATRTTDPTGAAPATTVNYLYAGGGDAAWGQKSGADLTRSVGLPGGVSMTNQAGTVTWSFPGLGGHSLVTRAGTTTSGLLLWDPFGQPVDPATYAIGTIASDEIGQVAGNTIWHQGSLKQAESVGSTTVVEMGARLYVPGLGRFLQVDPIEGGVDNDYVWPPDPINASDVTGLRSVKSRLTDPNSIVPPRKQGKKWNPSSLLPKPLPPKVFPADVRKWPSGPVTNTPRTGPKWGPLVEIKGITNVGVGVSFCALLCLNASVDNDLSGRVGIGFGPKIAISGSAGASSESTGGLYAGGNCTAAWGLAGVYVEGGYQQNGPKNYSGGGVSVGAAAGCSFDVGWGW